MSSILNGISLLFIMAFIPGLIVGWLWIAMNPSGFWESIVMFIVSAILYVFLFLVEIIVLLLVAER